MSSKMILEDGKYLVVYDSDKGTAQAYRYGELWRDLTGDKLFLAMFDRILELEAERAL